MEMDVLTGDGRIVTCSRTENSDLFFGFPNSYGTLGYALRLRIELEPTHHVAERERCARVMLVVVAGEVKAVLVGETLMRAPDIGAKSAVLAKFLIPIQKSGADRDAIIAQLRAAKDQAAIEALWQTLAAAFADAKSETSTGSGQQARRDLQERRRIIADLLYNIQSDNAWHARVQTVVGLNEYAGAADRQADRLAKAAERIRIAIADERTQFVKDYLSVIPELEVLSKELKRYDERSAEQKGLLNRATALKNTRTAEVAEFNTKIQEATRVAAAETAALQSLQQRLFAVQKQLAAARDENQKLERDIRAQEAGK
jgi:hypothetical protein